MAKAEKMLTPRRSYGNVDCSLIPWTVWRMLEKILLKGYQKALKLYPLRYSVNVTYRLNHQNLTEICVNYTKGRL